VTPRHCTGKTCDDNRDEPGTGRWTDRMLCRRCVSRLQRNLAELTWLEQWLTSNKARGSVTHEHEERHTKAPFPPLPVRVDVLDLLDGLHATITSWAMLVRDERGLRGPDHDTIPNLTAWLLGQLDWIIDQPWVDDLDDELRDRWDDVQREVPYRPGWHPLPTPCPNPDCGEHRLGRRDGSDHVECRACDERWPEDDYRRLVTVLAWEARCA
jgi:hypothetical protein